MSGDEREIIVPVLGDEAAETDARVLAEAVRAAQRHPAARITSQRVGVHRVELVPERTLPVSAPEGDDGWERLIGQVVVPAVHALECYRCGALLRPGPSVALHLQGHRDEYAARRPWWRRVLRAARGALYRITHTSWRS